MRVRRVLERLARAAARWPVVTLAVVLALALGGAALALRLRPNTGSDTFVSRSSPSSEATANDQRHFGGDPVVILIREPLPALLETKDLATVSRLEACLAGQVVVPNQQLQAFTPAPAGAQTPYGGLNSPCGRLMKAQPAQVVYGPGTFLNRAVAAVNEQVVAVEGAAQQAVTNARQNAYRLALDEHLPRRQALAAANAAGQLATQQEYEQLVRMYLTSGITGQPKIDDRQFIAEIVFDQTRGPGWPKARFAYLFPSANSALIQVRLKSTLSAAQQAQAISWIRQAVGMPMFRLAYGSTYTVSGVPVLTHDLASAITGSIAGLLIAALVVMAVMLLVVFRSRLRLLPLVIALAAVGITFGVVSLVGASLTMASIAVLPILIGLAVDYGIQFQARVEEVRGIGTPGAGSASDEVARATIASAPTIATAALATAAGFLALLLSPVPMVRGFGALLIVGIAIALACALSVGTAAMVLRVRYRRAPGAGRRRRRRGMPSFGVVGASARGAAEILSDARTRMASLLSATARAALAAAARRPGRVLLVGLLVAVTGWIVDARTPVQSDVTKLVPSSMPALRDLNALEHVTGVSGEIDVVVRSPDVATSRTIGWMLRYQDALLSHYGYVEANGCAHATLCPALSLPDLFCSSARVGLGACKAPSTGTIMSFLRAVPTYFSQAVITRDRREATLTFGIRLTALSRQQRVIDYMRSQLHPPPGTSAELAGLPVLASQADASLSSPGGRLLMLAVGLGAVGLLLLAILRAVERALLPLVPIVLATGWSSLILFVTGTTLNPMSATLGALVIAISTEFSVLLSERFQAERRRGFEPARALARTYRFTGSAVLASGITAIAGFGVLTLSSITMLRDFGLVTLIDLSVSLAGVLLVLPSALALSEPEGAWQSVRQLTRRAGDWLLRRRRARVA
ncbi:MAG: MMPL family transporter [Solirubrobacterales bacterium]|nr:MMPL family transporter [Solirubrobacterales bacterium]